MTGGGVKCSIVAGSSVSGGSVVGSSTGDNVGVGVVDDSVGPPIVTPGCVSFDVEKAQATRVPAPIRTATITAAAPSQMYFLFPFIPATSNVDELDDNSILPAYPKKNTHYHYIMGIFLW
jgi:hypothetical protein